MSKVHPALKHGGYAPSSPSSPVKIELPSRNCIAISLPN